MENIIKSLLEDLAKKLELEISAIKMTEKEGVLHLNIETEEPSLLIGHGGETIRALQHIIKILAWRKHNSDAPLFLDVDNYRYRQEESVRKLAERKAHEVRGKQQPLSLLPMSPYFRRIVHLHLAKPEFEDLETESIGENDQRKIVIKPKNLNASEDNFEE